MQKVISIFVVLGTVLIWFFTKNTFKIDGDRTVGIQEKNIVVNIKEDKENNLIPPKKLNCQFYSQAPTWNWNQPYQDYCEEASIILWLNCLEWKNVWLNEYLSQLDGLWAYEQKNWYEKDVSMEEIKKILLKKYWKESKIIKNPTFDKIKKILDKWHLMIVWVAGQQLWNPYYSWDGPIYHVVLVVGYDWNNIITHDVWISKWENYRYDNKHFINSIHNWSKENILEWEKVILEIY